MTLNNIRGKIIELQWEKFTQIGMIDSGLGNDIYMILSRYFSNHKYIEDDLVLYKGMLPIVSNELGEVSRNKYECINIASQRDIDDLLIAKKGNILMDYHLIALQNIDMAIELECLEKQYQVILEKIQKSYPSDYLIQIEEMNINLESILTKNIKPYISQSHSNYEKILQILKLLAKMEGKNNQEYLLYLQHVETYLMKDELKSIRQFCESLEYLTLVIATNKEAYLDYSMVDKINFIYKNKVEYLPPMEVLLEKINCTIKKNVHITDKELEKFLKCCSYDLFEQSYSGNDLEADIFEAIQTHYYKKEKEDLELVNCMII